MNKWLTPIAGLLLAAPATAQLLPDAGDDAAPEIRRYTVEIIIFEYAEDVYAGTEIFVPELLEPPAPDQETDDMAEDDAEEIIEPDEETSAVEAAVPFHYVTLRGDDLTLADTWQQLERLDAYRPLMHFGWTQITMPDAEPRVLELERFGQPPPGLDGTLTLYLSRFLHLVVDLSLLAPERDEGYASHAPRYDAPVSFGDRRMVDDYDDRYRPEYAPLRYRIVEDRIVRNGETRYYDHPKFGVIAKVTRVDESSAPLVGR